MTYVLSVVFPPVDGAKHGKAAVMEPVTQLQYAGDVAGDKLIASEIPTLEARAFGNELARLGTGVNVLHKETGLTFRVEPVRAAPHPCPCCGGLVLVDDHAYAHDEDAYCLGCFTWDRNVSPCLPGNSAHPNPWHIEATGAKWLMEAVIDLGDETTYDARYSSTDGHEIYDDEDNALIAWPGLRSDQFIEITISKISEED